MPCNSAQLDARRRIVGYPDQKRAAIVIRVAPWLRSRCPSYADILITDLKQSRKRHKTYTDSRRSAPDEPPL
jgi:hypothetical protein